MRHDIFPLLTRIHSNQRYGKQIVLNRQLNTVLVINTPRPLPLDPDGVVTVSVSLNFSSPGFRRKKLLLTAMSLEYFPVGTTAQAQKKYIVVKYFIAIILVYY